MHHTTRVRQHVADLGLLGLRCLVRSLHRLGGLQVQARLLRWNQHRPRAAATPRRAALAAAGPSAAAASFAAACAALRRCRARQVTLGRKQRNHVHQLAEAARHVARQRVEERGRGVQLARCGVAEEGAAVLSCMSADAVGAQVQAPRCARWVA